MKLKKITEATIFPGFCCRREKGLFINDVILRREVILLWLHSVIIEWWINDGKGGRKLNFSLDVIYEKLKVKSKLNMSLKETEMKIFNALFQ